MRLLSTSFLRLGGTPVVEGWQNNGMSLSVFNFFVQLSTLLTSLSVFSSRSSNIYPSKICVYNADYFKRCATGVVEFSAFDFLKEGLTPIFTIRSLSEVVL